MRMGVDEAGQDVMPRASTTSASAGNVSSSRLPPATMRFGLDQHRCARHGRALVPVDQQAADDGEVCRRLGGRARRRRSARQGERPP